MRQIIFFLIVVVGTNLYAEAQASPGHSGHAMKPASSQETMPDMPGMSHSTQLGSLIESSLSHTASGTDAEPASTPSHMLMFSRSNWSLMLHGEAFLNEVQQSGPCGS